MDRLSKTAAAVGVAAAVGLAVQPGPVNASTPPAKIKPWTNGEKAMYVAAFESNGTSAKAAQCLVKLAANRKTGIAFVDVARDDKKATAWVKKHAVANAKCLMRYPAKSPTATTTPAPAPTTTTTAPTTTTVVLSATGPSDDTVFYGPDGSQNQAAGNVSQSYTVTTPADYYAIDAMSLGDGDVTCTITVNGQVMSTHTSNSDSSCQVGYLLGQWQVES